MELQLQLQLLLTPAAEWVVTSTVRHPLVHLEHYYRIA